MKLTEVERLILWNQCRILAALYPKEASDHAEFAEILQRGYEQHYGDHARHIEEELPEEQSREVSDILSMFESIKDSFEALEDQSGIEPRNIQFRGFDEGEESHLLGYTSFVLNKEGRFYDAQEDGTRSV